MNDRNKHLDDWFRKIDAVIPTAQAHPQLRLILQNNSKLRNQDLDSVLSGAAVNMKDLGNLTVDFETLVDVLALVLEITKMALKQLHKTYAAFAKIPFWMMKTNNQLEEKSNDIAAMVIDSFCEDFRWLRQQLSSGSDQASVPKCLLIARIALTLLAETQKMYPNNKGTPEILRTTIEIVLLEQNNTSPEVAELDSKFNEIVVEQRLAASFYEDFFKPFSSLTDQQLCLVLQFCNGVVEDLSSGEKLLETAMRRSDDSNFCLLLIEFLANNPQTMHLCPELQDQLLLKTVDLILSENLNVQDFQFIEKALVVKMCSNDYWQSLICYQIFREILTQLRSSIAIAKYRQFFQKLFTKFPGRSICSIPKLFVMSLLKLILQDIHEPGTTKERFIDLDCIYIPGSDFQERFNGVFRELMDDPCADNYYKIVGCLKFLRAGVIDTANTETMKNFFDLMKMVEGENFHLYPRLICGIMDVLRSATNDELKMSCMVKLTSALNGVDTMPWETELKLLAMLFSYIPLAKVKTGLPQILTREFTKLLVNSPNKSALIRIVQTTMMENLNDWSFGPPSPQHVEFMKFLNSFNKVTSRHSPLQTLLDSRKLKRLHKCIDIEHVTESMEASTDFYSLEPSSVSNLDLQNILEYSQTLAKENLDEHDLEIISEIVSTLSQLSLRMAQ